MSVGNDEVGTCNIMVDAGNGSIDVQNVTADIGNDYVCVDCKLGLEGDAE